MTGDSPAHKETIECGAGNDSVGADANDAVAVDCETVLIELELELP